MHPEIYIDYAIRLLEAAKKAEKIQKRKKRKKAKLSEGFLGSIVQKVKNFFKSIINKVKAFWARIMGRKSAEEVTTQTENRLEDIVKLSQNPVVVSNAEKELVGAAIEIRDVLKENCDKPECKELLNQVNHVVSEMKSNSSNVLEMDLIGNTDDFSAAWGTIKAIAYITGIYLIYDFLGYLYKKITGKATTEEYEGEAKKGIIRRVVGAVLRRVRSAVKTFFIIVGILGIITLIGGIVGLIIGPEKILERLEYLANKMKNELGGGNIQ